MEYIYIVNFFPIESHGKLILQNFGAWSTKFIKLLKIWCCLNIYNLNLVCCEELLCQIIPKCSQLLDSRFYQNIQVYLHLSDIHIRWLRSHLHKLPSSLNLCVAHCAFLYFLFFPSFQIQCFWSDVIHKFPWGIWIFH